MENSAEKNRELILKIQNGDEKALETLCIFNAGLVKSIALRYAGHGVETDDLIQIGNIGLIKATRGFDFSYNTVFSTYAVIHIAGEIKRFIRDDGQIKVTREIKQKAALLYKSKQSFENKYLREPTVGELSEICNIAPEEAAEIICAQQSVRSLSEVIGDSEELTLESQIEDTSDAIKTVTDNVALAEAIKKLPKIQREIIHLRYEKELTQSQTGKILGLTQVKVSREEKKMLTQLRKAL